MGDGAELRVEGVDAGVAVVLEEAAKLTLDVVSNSAVLDDKVEELHGDLHVEPLNNGEVIPQPAVIGLGRSSVVGDVVQQGAAAEVDLQEVTLVVVVLAMKIKDDGDEGSDICDCIAEGKR